jgi:hypothetical protein
VARTRQGSLLSRAPLAAVLAAGALLVALLAGCGGSTATADDPFTGYWIGGGATGMKLVHIVKDGEAYKVYANPDYQAPAPKVEGDALVIDAHAVKMTLVPAGADALTLELSGSALKKPQTTAMKRVSQAQYADAATGFGLDALRRGLVMWKAGGAKNYPPAAEVTPTGMLSKMIAWPNNLFTGQPMQPRESQGDYTYKRLDGGKGYSLVGYLSDGKTIGK